MYYVVDRRAFLLSVTKEKSKNSIHIRVDISLTLASDNLLL